MGISIAIHMMKEAPNESAPENVSPPLNCDDCGQSFKTAQGLAGHRRLAHSTSTRSELESKQGELVQRETSAKRREVEAARQLEAVHRQELNLAGRERAIQQLESVTEEARVGGIVVREVAGLPEVTSETILRVEGTDYRVEGGRLVHLYWPEGEKTELEDGQWFRFDGRPYRVHDGKLQPVRSSTILARVLGEED